jgi:hypothetical protein
MEAEQDNRPQIYRELISNEKFDDKVMNEVNRLVGRK